MNPAIHHSRSPSRGKPGFTIVEVLMAVAIFGMVILAIYETWSAVIKASIAGKNAAAMAQRARISIKAIEDALVTAQMFSANGKYYYFLADTADEKCGGISFVARLPASFPGVGHYDHVVRRVSFLTDANRRLIMTQAPMMVAQEKETEPYSLQLAQDVTLFMFEFWDEQKKEYVSTWARTNQLPRLVRVALGLGKSSQNSQMPQDLVTRTVAMPSTAVQAQWQGASAVPGRPGGMPSPMPGAMPGAMPGMMPGGMPGAMPGGMPGNMPGMYPNQPVRR